MDQPAQLAPLAQPGLEPLSDEEMQQKDGGCWICDFWGPPYEDPGCPGMQAPQMNRFF
jgi:hypothetical protein